MHKLIRSDQPMFQLNLFLLQETEDGEFSKQEWKLGDQSHWNRRHPDLKKI